MIRQLLVTAFGLIALPAMACETIVGPEFPLSLCVDDTVWQAQPQQGDADFFYLTPDQTMAFMMIGEKGADVPIADYRKAILFNAQGGEAGTNTVKVLAERIENVGGEPWNVIQYNVGAGVDELAYQNTTP